MTIINSVIIGGSGGGDEVEAYALGDAKNAVKDDKVSLNFSANMATIEPEIQKQAISNYSGGYVFSIQGGRYIYTSQNSSSSYNGTPGYIRDSSGNYIPHSSLSIGLGSSSGYLLGSNLWTNANGITYQLFGASSSYSKIPDTINSSTQVLMSDDNRVLVASNRASSPAKLIVFTREDENAPFVELFRYTGAENDRVATRFAFFPGKYAGKYRGVCMRGGPFGGEGYASYEIDLETKSFKILQSYSGGNYKYNPICYKGFVVYLAKTSSFTLSDLYVARYSVDGTLTDDTEATSSLRAALSTQSITLDMSKVVDGYLVFGVTNQIRLGYDEGKGFFVLPSPFSDKTGGNTFYYEGGIVCWSSTLAWNTNDFEIRRQLAPIDQPYVATEPIDGQFYANQTLTGIVKENNNGVLKVSTVEDPNNPPPAVPDEAGLKTVINYGSPIAKTNYTVVGSPTISGSTVTDFTKSSYVQSNVTVGSSAGTVEYYTAFTVRDLSAIGNNTWTTIIDTVPHSTQKGMTLWIASDVKTLNLSARSSSSTYVDAAGHSALVEGVKYFAKAVYDGSTWKTYLSTSGHDDYNPFMPEGEVACSFYPTQQTLTVGRDTIFGGLYNSGSSIEVDLAETKVAVNGVVQWVGAGKDFGSVSVGYGYFRNTLTKPSDKYVSYEGGTLTEDNISGRKASTMNIILGRKADMGSWTSDTKGYLSAQDRVVLGVNKKLSTPVYLWHDYSYISPAVPETLEPDVITGGSDYVVVGSPVISSGVASGFSADNYITASEAVGSTNNATYKARFRVDAIGIKGPIMHYEMLFGLNIDESGNLYDWNWGNSAAVNICATTAGHTYTASVNINGTTRSWTVTDETTGETFTNSLTDSKTTSSGDVVLTYGRSSSPTATTYFNGSIYLAGCSASIGDTVVWSALTSGAISLPASWKNIDGVLYDYPNGFPKTQASDLLDDNAVREGSNNLYATRTGDSCGLVISTAPYGVDSYAIIGTVELDANGVITSYTPIDATPAPTTIYIDNRDVSDQVEVVRLPDGSGYAAKVPNTATYRRYTVDSFSSEAAYWGVGIDPSDISLNLQGSEISFSESNTPSAYLYVVNSDSLNGVRRPYEGHLNITDNNYFPAA